MVVCHNTNGGLNSSWLKMKRNNTSSWKFSPKLFYRPSCAASPSRSDRQPDKTAGKKTRKSIYRCLCDRSKPYRVHVRSMYVYVPYGDHDRKRSVPVPKLFRSRVILNTKRLRYGHVFYGWNSVRHGRGYSKVWLQRWAVRPRYGTL